MLSQSALISQPFSRTTRSAWIKNLPDPFPKSIPYSVIFVFLATSILVAILMFPGGFSLVKNPISQLGSPVLNPKGHWWFRIGVCVTCLFKITCLVGELRTQEDHPPLTVLIAGLEIVANLGFAGIAIIPEERYSVHFALAGVAFFGYMAWLMIISWKQFFEGRWMSRFGELSWIPKGITISLIAVGLLIMLTWTAKLKMSPSSLTGGSPLLQFAPWEWLTFLSICGWDWYLHSLSLNFSSS